MPTPKIKRVTKRDGREVPFDRSRIRNAIKKAILAVEARPKMDPEREAELFTNEVVDELQQSSASHESPHIERIQDVIIEVLHRDLARGNGSYSSTPEGLWMGYMLYREGHVLVRDGLLDEEHFSPNTKPQETLAELREWNDHHNCDTVQSLNGWYRGTELGTLIGCAEMRSNMGLMGAVKRVLDALITGGLRAIIITGPSSSGKTVTSQKMLRLLSAIKPSLRIKTLEVDNYFRSEGVEELVYDVDGKKVVDYNFELPETYDIPLINEHLEALMRWETVMVPSYDFARRVRLDKETPLKLEAGELLLIDCLHALSPQLTEAIPKENKFKLYIEPLSLLEDDEGRPVCLTDIRLLRRMIRDVRTRGHSIPATLWHWHLVRKGERFILPYLNSADMMIDTGLPYELPILKHFLESRIRSVLPVFERNPDLYDGRERARRVLRLFSQLEAASQEQISIVPPDSILREFIGGSEFFDE
jgi:uridine kinase